MGILTSIGMFFGSNFGSMMEGVGTIIDNNLKINLNKEVAEVKAVKVTFGENDIKTRSIIKKRGTDLKAILATNNPEMFRIGEKVKFKAFLRADISFWPASGPTYFDTRTWGGYIRPLNNY